MSVWKYFEVAARVATMKDDRRTFRLGAVGVRTDGVMVAACNGPVRKHTDVVKQAHAESRLIRKLDKGSVVYVVRIAREDDEYRIARPCRACQVALKSRKVSKVYYTVGPGEYGVMTF